ncbi:MAG: hypothetical protein Q7R79_03420 [bacterium]|nr:hypothetical protein [bacterium]
MSYVVEVAHQMRWDDIKSEVVELPEVYYRVVGSDGRTVLGTGETRIEALENASSHILLPKHRLV